MSQAEILSATERSLPTRSAPKADRMSAAHGAELTHPTRCCRSSRRHQGLQGSERPFGRMHRAIRFRRELSSPPGTHSGRWIWPRPRSPGSGRLAQAFRAKNWNPPNPSVAQSERSSYCDNHSHPWLTSPESSSPRFRARRRRAAQDCRFRRRAAVPRPHSRRRRALHGEDANAR